MDYANVWLEEKFLRFLNKFDYLEFARIFLRTRSKNSCFISLMVVEVLVFSCTQVGQLRSNKNLCLDLDEAKNVIASSCNDFDAKQMWTFLPIPT